MQCRPVYHHLKSLQYVILAANWYNGSLTALKFSLRMLGFGQEKSLVIGHWSLVVGHWSFSPTPPLSHSPTLPSSPLLLCSSAPT